MADLRRLLTYHDLLGEPPCEVADDQHGRDPPAKPPRVRTLLQLAAWELEYIASYDVDMAVDVLCSPLYCPAMAPVISVSVRRRAMRVRLGIPRCKSWPRSLQFFSFAQVANSSTGLLPIAAGGLPEPDLLPLHLELAVLSSLASAAVARDAGRAESGEVRCHRD